MSSQALIVIRVFPYPPPPPPPPSVVACGWLPSPKNGTKHGKLYIQGGNLSFSCDDGYTLTGSLQRSCLPDGSWSGEQAYCT